MSHDQHHGYYLPLPTPSTSLFRPPPADLYSSSPVGSSSPHMPPAGFNSMIQGIVPQYRASQAYHQQQHHSNTVGSSSHTSSIPTSQNPYGYIPQHSNVWQTHPQANRSSAQTANQRPSPRPSQQPQHQQRQRQPSYLEPPPFPMPFPLPMHPRLPVVDLTSELEQPSRKRRRPNDDADRDRQHRSQSKVIALDISEDEDDGDDKTDDELEMQREKERKLAVKAAEKDAKPKKLADSGCVICLEERGNTLSITPCGHLFCHKCVVSAVKVSMGGAHKTQGRCPICRGKVALKDIIVLKIKKGGKGKGRALPED
ncbi:hypothetical protein EDC01DRAFT_424438 [Geopyxis carbonaria]|nr:hypothetical protein EDC01DRAFT_424438 [Geopyxis carbonaria]